MTTDERIEAAARIELDRGDRLKANQMLGWIEAYPEEVAAYIVDLERKNELLHAKIDRVRKDLSFSELEGGKMIRGDKQFFYVQLAVDLAEKNPEAEIHFLVASDEVFEDYGWTAQYITYVELCRCYKHEDRMYTDPGELMEVLCYEALDKENLPTKAEILSMMTPAILIYTRA